MFILLTHHHTQVEIFEIFEDNFGDGHPGRLGCNHRGTLHLGETPVLPRCEVEGAQFCLVNRRSGRLSFLDCCLGVASKLSCRCCCRCCCRVVVVFVVVVVVVVVVAVIVAVVLPFMLDS